MRLSLLFLAIVGSVVAQTAAPSAAATTAAAAIPTSAPSAAAGGDGITADPSLSSEMAMASCVTGASYSNCQAALTTGGLCTVGDANARVACACSSASHAISCLNICSISYDAAMVAMVSSTCKSLGGPGIPATKAGATATNTGAAATKAASGSSNGAMPTAMAKGLGVAAAVAFGAML